ncbi:catechol 2,3-dioxygenase-like lactoylglutathione lyase family enzyme [Nocardioides luteus]|uniref:Glyoxalase n=1 Tax=Nocardioides luteus TaxID=1844 RepID=A0ABQ5SP93_9ACTN|nr:VOC family protein [Nocardioides luteus]MDR7312904.1 catechol 2,3-dioxygenase-like lactoylglutathione lyase family enzyme [Nocardioides luteus]GGR45479.1 glyoxalase [Nocardioides luteus]GLJ65965.1 glyoxalase [Nocardioides luteus]
MIPGFRYIVDDIPAAVAFYRELGFEDVGPKVGGFAMLDGHGLRLFLNAPGAGGAGHVADDGTVPSPGGWGRIQIVVADLDEELRRLVDVGVQVRTSRVDGVGGAQAVIEDPAGNPVELFTPA